MNKGVYLKKITPEMYDKIRAAGLAVAELETGCRKATKAQAKFEIDQIKKHAATMKKLPAKPFKIIFFRHNNLGTKAYGDTYTDYYLTSELTLDDIKITDKSIICYYRFSTGEIYTREVLPINKVYFVY